MAGISLFGCASDPGRVLSPRGQGSSEEHRSGRERGWLRGKGQGQGKRGRGPQGEPPFSRRETRSRLGERYWLEARRGSKQEGSRSGGCGARTQVKLLLLVASEEEQGSGTGPCLRVSVGVPRGPGGLLRGGKEEMGF